ncbi:MAG: hypothetical protein RRA94_00235 [Bacteroidota bacterium]|nr:hypothetical protein [Bacteroidota bacterium]
MSFTHHIMARTSAAVSTASDDVPYHSSTASVGDREDTDARISLCRGCYEGRGDHTLYLPRRKARRCGNCADAHERDSCFLAKCVFCGEDAILPRREGTAMWFACDKHRYFTLHPEKWKPLPLSAEENRAIRRQKLRRLSDSLRRAFFGLSAVTVLYFLFFRATLRERYDFDVVDTASSLWSGTAEFFTGVLRFGMEIAQGL